MTHQQGGGEIGKGPTSAKQGPNDIDGKIGVRCKQFTERNPRVGLDMSQHQGFLLHVWRNLVRPEVL